MTWYLSSVKESLLRYWGGRYTVAGIYDPYKVGARDRFWDIAVQRGLDAIIPDGNK